MKGYTPGYVHYDRNVMPIEQAAAVLQKSSGAIAGPSGQTPWAPVSKADLILLSQMWAEACGGEVSDGGAMLYAIAERYTHQPRLLELLQSADMQLYVIAGARWATEGFPQVTLNGQLAAALCATDVPAEVARDVQQPWSGWLIEVPSSLITIIDPIAGRAEIRRILVTRERREVDGVLTWSWGATAATGVMVYRFGVTSEYLATPKLIAGPLATPKLIAGPAEMFPNCLFPLDVGDEDERASALIGRLILGVCLMMEDKKNLRRAPKGEFRWRPRASLRRPGVVPPPETRTYVLGAEVAVDCRSAVREYLQGGSSGHKPPSVQFLVRGHWRNQAHGPRHALHRRQWISPYWKGPEGTPVVMRARALEKDGGADEES